MTGPGKLYRCLASCIRMRLFMFLQGHEWKSLGVYIDTTFQMATEQKKYMIITADDFGYSDERDDGIIECFNKGIISNVSLMVNGVSAENAVMKAKKAGLPMGLHLNLTEGTLVNTSSTKSLQASDGFMHGMFGFREVFSKGLIDPSEVEVEIQAQIDKFEQLTGSKPVNVDGHQHIHVFPGICEIFARVLKQNNIKLTRVPIESDFSDDSKCPYKVFLMKIIQQSKEAVEILGQSDVWAPGFAGLKTMSKEMNVQSLQACIQDAFKMQLSTKNSPGKKDGHPTCELMTHPGKRTGAIGGCGNGPDEFSQSEDREHEINVLSTQNMADFYRASNIHIISFKDILAY